MRGSTSVLERGDLIVQGLPFRAEDVRACNDHVDFVRAGFHRAPDFRDTFLERRKAGRESRGHRGHVNAAPLDGASRALDESVIDAHSRDLDIEAFDAQLLHEFLLKRLPRLGAQAAYTLVRIVSGERRQIHASDGTQEPSRLPFLLYRSPRTDGLRPALDSAGVHAHRAHPIQIERYAAVGLE